MDRRRTLLTAGLAVLTIALAFVAVVASHSDSAGGDPDDLRLTIALGGDQHRQARLTLPEQSQSSASIAAAAAAAGHAGATVSLGGPAAAPPVAPGFVGLSVEYTSIAKYAATGALFEQLLRNLTPGQRPVLRIGGDSADHTWWPVPGQSSPGLSYALTPQWLATVRGLAQATDARLVLGLNLEANRPQLAGAEAKALIDGIGRRSVAALEIGNEPNVYAAFPWYRAGTRKVYGRPPSWNVKAYIRELRATIKALPALPVWGPSIGTPKWMGKLPQILAAAPSLSTVTYHSYPTTCYSSPHSSTAPTLANLLAKSSSAGIAARLEPWVRLARRTGRTLRVDEINTVACAGRLGTPNIAAALWALQAGFALARAGVSGVNVHTFWDAKYRLFSFQRRAGSWRADVLPEYYGWMMFSQAAPAGARLLNVQTTGDPQVQAFATRAGGATRVVLVNDSASRGATVSLAAPGSSVATIERLRAPSISARRGLTYAGMAIDRSPSGLLAGAARASALNGPGRYSISMPAASAALVTLSQGD